MWCSEWLCFLIRLVAELGPLAWVLPLDPVLSLGWGPPGTIWILPSESFLLKCQAPFARMGASLLLLGSTTLIGLATLREFSFLV